MSSLSSKMLKDAEHLLEIKWGKNHSRQQKMDFCWESRMLTVENKQLFPNCISAALLIFHCAPCIPGPGINGGALRSWPGTHCREGPR